MKMLDWSVSANRLKEGQGPVEEPVPRLAKILLPICHKPIIPETGYDLWNKYSIWVYNWQSAGVALKTFMVGVRVQVKEVKGSPRPPSQWLGKRGRIVEMGLTADGPARPGSAAQRIHAVQFEGADLPQLVPEAWLKRL